MQIEYQEPSPISLNEAIKIFQNGKKEEIAKALIGLALNSENPLVTEKWCLYYLNSQDVAIKKAAITCIGHLARLNGKVSKEVIMPIFALLSKKENLKGIIDDAIDDINMFCE